MWNGPSWASTVRAGQIEAAPESGEDHPLLAFGRQGKRQMLLRLTPLVTCSGRMSTCFDRGGTGNSYNYCRNRRLHGRPKEARAPADRHRSRRMTATAAAADAAADELRSEFIRVLRSRRRNPDVPLEVEHGKPVANPTYQGSIDPSAKEVMESCPKEDIPDLQEILNEENIYLKTEEGEQGHLPVIILSVKESISRKRPAIVFLHSSYKCKEWLRPLLEAYASRGYVTIAVDSRYHGERAFGSKTAYKDALVSSWKNGDTMPFIFDTVWDLIKLADYLVQREDIDPTRIGITGESLGGMHAWFAAAADPRYSVVVSIIGVQGFKWAIDNDKWEARVNSIKSLFEEAQNDSGKSSIDKEVVQKVWDKIAPGLASQFDAPQTIPMIAPRPLLILNGALDPRCPVDGLETPRLRAAEAYANANCKEKFEVIFEPGIGHQMTASMVLEASKWFDKFLK